MGVPASKSGVTGAVVDSIEEAAAAFQVVSKIDRSSVRKRFEERFSLARMARDHEALYALLIDAQSDRPSTHVQLDSNGEAWY